LGGIPPTSAGGPVSPVQKKEDSADEKKKYFLDAVLVLQGTLLRKGKHVKKLI